MFTLTKTFQHTTGFEITPFSMEEKGWIFLPQEIEKQLGYEDLSDTIRKSDSFVEGIEYIVLRDSNLQSFKALLNCRNTIPPVPKHEAFKHATALIVLTEAGLYTAMILSRKPNAQAFRRWITGEVLPAIRQTGTYRMENALQQKSGNPPQDALALNSVLKPFMDALDRRLTKDREEQKRFNQDTLDRLATIEDVLSDCKNQADVFGGWKRIQMLVKDMTAIYSLTDEERQKYFSVLCKEHGIPVPAKITKRTKKTTTKSSTIRKRKTANKKEKEGSK